MMFVCCTCTILRIFYRTNRTDHHRCRLFYFLVNKGISLYISSTPSTKPPVSGKITSFVFSYIHCISYKHRFITKQFCQLTGWNLKNYSVNFIKHLPKVTAVYRCEIFCHIHLRILIAYLPQTKFKKIEPFLGILFLNLIDSIVLKKYSFDFSLEFKLPLQV